MINDHHQPLEGKDRNDQAGDHDHAHDQDANDKRDGQIPNVCFHFHQAAVKTGFMLAKEKTQCFAAPHVRTVMISSFQNYFNWFYFLLKNSVTLTPLDCATITSFEKENECMMMMMTRMMVMMMAAVGKHCMTVILIARHRGAPTTSRNGISPLIPILPRTSHTNHTLNLCYLISYILHLL